MDYIEEFIVPNDSKLSLKSESKSEQKIAGFDLDYTLISPRSKNKFPKNKNDWKLLKNVKEKLIQLHEDNYLICIFTNQKGIKNEIDKENFLFKLKNISTELGIPFKVFVSISTNYRKPIPKLYYDLIKNYTKVDFFYVGDAAGRFGDFSDSDLKFALNVKCPFFTPEEYFLDEPKITFGSPEHPLKLYDAQNSRIQEILDNTDKKMIILVGSPSSGKSTFANNLSDTFKIINQDTLKTKSKCLKETELHLKNGLNVIIDNTNRSIEIRKLYIDLANKYDVCVTIFFFNRTKDEVFHLNTYRSLITNKHLSDVVIHTYYKNLEIPTKDEAEVVYVNLVIENPPELLLMYLT